LTAAEESREPADALLATLRQLHSVLAADMAERFHRDLPFTELISDRWERAGRLGFGEDASIYDNTYVLGDVEVGRHTWIGPLVMLDGRAGITIGDYCSISTGVQIYTHDTVRWALSGGEAPFELGAVRIGDCTYIGSQSVVLHGVSIGDHCVIGAHSLVDCDVEPYTIAFGVPARPRGRVEVADDGEISLAIEREGE
jgi:acetyltransferase-like isoleucine patch superfamily enzyme